MAQEQTAEGVDALQNPGSIATPSPAAPENNIEKKPTWQSQPAEEGILEIEELPTKPKPTKKKGWNQNKGNNNNMADQSGDDDINYNTAAEALRNNQQKAAQQKINNIVGSNVGSKPKLTNMSLLSSAVAHATLERCLLGVNGGETVGSVLDADKISSSNTSPINSSNNNTKNGTPINYSKQCKPGHVIDILELRRLSSRGVPDEPPEVHRARTESAPAVHTGQDTLPAGFMSSSTPHSVSNDNLPSTTQGGLNKPHRSYRPLVWRVLLGYLPPQTDLWNDVLARDRKLYDTLVHELFSSTCPKPHDLLTDEELRTLRREQERKMYGNGNQVYRSDEKKRVKEGGGAEFTIDDDDEEDGNDDAAPLTPTQSTSDDAPPPPPASTPITPGLLSARMQQEWVRGEWGQDTIFDGQSSNNNGTVSSPGGMNVGRISPMCAMNTPRTRIRKEAFRRKDDALVEEEEKGEDEQAAVSGEDANESDDKKDEEKLSSQMKESLLLPDDDDDEEDGNKDENGEENAMDTIDVAEDKEKINSDNEDKPTAEVDTPQTTPATPESSPGAKLTRSISISKTSSEDENAEGVELCRQSSVDNDDDAHAAISPNPSSSIPETDEEENILLLDEIRKDVIRTHPDLRFFLEPKEDLGQKRYAALERILFVWAKLNKGVRYVQGMNEIVGTLYFVLAHDSNEDWSREAEADTYFLFNALMVEMRDIFVPDLDEADTGIHGRISNMITLLSLHDPEVRCHLDSVGIDPSFYSVRWLTTLLSREFLLPDTIRLWDSMFASTHKDNFVRYVSVTMVMVIREEMLCGDFSACLRLLQAYPPTNLDRLLESSRALWIYESQITLACHKGGISLGHALRSINPPPAIIMAYGLQGGVAPPISAQVRHAGERGLAVARGAANGASTTIGSAGRSFFGNAINFWRTDSQAKKEVRRSKTTI